MAVEARVTDMVDTRMTERKQMLLKWIQMLRKGVNTLNKILYNTSYKSASILRASVVAFYPLSFIKSIFLALGLLKERRNVF